jgi:branched-chain amino acid transport system ATP-binding protein
LVEPTVESLGVLAIANVSKRFGSFYALRDVSLEVPTGKIVLLIGPNGSGKSTLINCVSGIYKPDGGKIWFNGADITGKQSYEIVEVGIGRSFQVPAPFKKLTVAENLLVCSRDNPGEGFLASIFKMTWKKKEDELVRRTFEILEVIGLDGVSDTLAGELSGGQLKLLELGRQLMLNAKLMLLDEPIGGVNPVLCHEILAHIRRIKESLGISFLIVEHRLDIIMEYVDCVYVMAQGGIVCEGTPTDIVNNKKLYEVYL